MRVLFALTAALLLAGGCGSDGERDGDEPVVDPGPSFHVPPKLAVQQVGRFDAPVHALEVPGTGLVAVVEQGGRVIVASGMLCSGAGSCPRRAVTEGSVVVDLRGQVSTGGEQGLLGMAFHPDWPNDERIFLNYTDRDGATRVEAWTLATPTAKAVRRQELLRIRQPYSNHNGGHLAFGPDGLLYVGTGDGGSGGDPEDRAQEDDALLGKMLRVDVDGGGGRGYAIPAGNLAVGAEEVWAVGLRNPWRFSFDARTGDLWIGDVGQDQQEEINALGADQLEPGFTPNFGWRRFEGFREFDASGRKGPGELVAPVLAYGRDDGCSVTGGVVYRGRAIPGLDGWYVFADFCGDDLRVVRSDGVPGSKGERGALEWRSLGASAKVRQVSSIAAVQGGELLVVSLDGSIGQLVVAQ